MVMYYQIEVLIPIIARCLNSKELTLMYRWLHLLGELIHMEVWCPPQIESILTAVLFLYLHKESILMVVSFKTNYKDKLIPPPKWCYLKYFHPLYCSKISIQKIEPVLIRLANLSTKTKQSEAIIEIQIQAWMLILIVQHF